MSKKCEISVIIPTYNEETNIEKCIRSLDGTGCTVYVLDSNSSDRTREIAQSLGALVTNGTWGTFSDKINWAIDNLPIVTPWTMRLDADETITDDLHKILIHQTFEDESIAAYAIRRRFVFLNRWIRFGGMYPSWQVRIWRTRRARMEVRELDEHMNFDGRLGYISADIVDDNNKDLTFWTEKHNIYSSREVKQHQTEVDQGDRAGFTAQALRRRWIKEKLYAWTPLFIRPFVQWFVRYFLLLGFLDGKAGLIYHTLRGFWYPFLIDAKLYEASRKRKNITKSGKL